MGYFQIEDFPIRQDRPRARFPFKHLQIGQSFLVPFEEEDALRKAAGNYNRKHRDQKISCRIEVGGIRAGRIA